RQSKGSLCCWILDGWGYCTLFSESISGRKLVLLSAAAKYIAPKQLLKDLQLVAKDATVGHLKDNELFKLYEYKLRNVPVSATVQFMRIVRMVEPYISTINVPTFIVQGKHDGIVPYSTAQYLYDKLPTTDKFLFFSTVRSE